MISAANAPAQKEGLAVWQTLAGPNGDFTIAFPGVPEHSDRTTPQTPFARHPVAVYTFANGQDSFNLNYKDLPLNAGVVDQRALLQEYERGLYVDGWIIASQSPLPDGGHQYELLMTLPSGSLTERRHARMQTRVYFRNRRMYTLGAMSVQAEHFTALAPQFFASLRFLKLPPAPPTPSRQALSAREIAAARSALKSLHKLAAAEAIAPGYEEYGKLLLAAKGEVDDSLADIRDGEVREELSRALEAYLDLRIAWNTTRGLLAMPVIGYEPQRTLIVKYGIPIDSRGDMPLMDFQGAITAIFKAAREHSERAADLLPR
jgi:hypothetical protein